MKETEEAEVGNGGETAELSDNQTKAVPNEAIYEPGRNGAPCCEASAIDTMRESSRYSDLDKEPPQGETAAQTESDDSKKGAEWGLSMQIDNTKKLSGHGDETEEGFGSAVRREEVEVEKVIVKYEKEKAINEDGVVLDSRGYSTQVPSGKTVEDEVKNEKREADTTDVEAVPNVKDANQESEQLIVFEMDKYSTAVEEVTSIKETISPPKQEITTTPDIEVQQAESSKGSPNENSALQHEEKVEDLPLKSEPNIVHQTAAKKNFSDGSLLRLFQSEFFDAFLHMFYLFHRTDTGAHEFLVNLLYAERTEDEVNFYLPQLCQLSLVRYKHSSLHLFLLDKASRSMHFALKISWLFHSIAEDNVSALYECAQKMSQETEMAVVNSKRVPSSTLSDAELTAPYDLFLRRRIMDRIRWNEAHKAGKNEAESDDAVNDKRMKPLRDPVMPSTFRQHRGAVTVPLSKVKVLGPYASLGNPLYISTSQLLLSKELWDAEDGLQHFLMKHRRSDYFNLLNLFTSLLIDISFTLVGEPDRSRRNQLLHAVLDVINDWMLCRRCSVAANEGTFVMTGLMIPVCTTGTVIPDSAQLLRIATEECMLLSSKKRAPYLLVFETADLDEDLTATTNKYGFSDHREFVDHLNERDGGSQEVKDASGSIKGDAHPSVESTQKPSLFSLSPSFLYVYDAIVNDLIMRGLTVGNDTIKLHENPLKTIRDVLRMNPECEQYADTTNADDSTLPIVDANHNAAITNSTPIGKAEDEDATRISTVNKQFLNTHTQREGRSVPDVSVQGSYAGSAIRDKSSLKRHLWGELWEDKCGRIRQSSPYGHLRTWELRCVLVKGGDDVRQELLASQLIHQFKNIFDDARLPLWLRPYEILVTGCNSGIIEFVPDTYSVDYLKRRFNVDSIARVFEIIFEDNVEARKNFIESHAAYSLVSYLLQVKDRHNGNLLVDSEGHLLHIDFGFMLSNCPGHINFETSPFKLTKEYLDIIGDEDSEDYEYFCGIMIQGFLEARKHADRIILTVEMMLSASKMPCFAGGTQTALDALKERFMINVSEKDCIDKIMNLIETSLNNSRTIQYDYYQKITNGIF